jgi:aldehyde:ferredoxin oxidoreductase
MSDEVMVSRRVLHIDTLTQKYHLDTYWSDSLLPVSLLLLDSTARKNNSDEITNKNFIIIGTGVLGGYPGLGLSVTTITGISPQSQRLGEAKIEGELASTLRSLMIDAVCIVGKSPNLIGLRIVNKGNDITVDFVECSELIGKSVWDTTQSIKSSENTILAIGKSGENQSLAASVVCNYGFPTQTGGFGALFGRLGIKYINFQKTNTLEKIPYLDQVSSEYMSQIRSGSVLTKYQFDPPGFGIYVNPTLSGYLAGDNFAEKLPEAANKFDGSSYMNFYQNEPELSCPDCPQNCLKMFITDSDKPKQGFMLHQLGVTVFASQWGESDTRRCIEFNSFCHELGVEHLYISALLTQERPDRDLPVKDLITTVINLKLNEKALTIKNMPIPPFDPRGNQGLGLAMALNPTGPRYDVVEHDIDFDPIWSWDRHSIFGREYGIPEGGLPIATLDSRRVNSVLLIWKLWSALDALGVCIFASPPTRDLRLTQVIGMVNVITKIQVTKEQILELGALRLQLMRRFNSLLGFTDGEDNLPDYFFNNSINDDTTNPTVDPIFGNENANLNGKSRLHSASLNKLDFENGKKFLYQSLGWDMNASINDSHFMSIKLNKIQNAFNNSKKEVR